MVANPVLSFWWLNSPELGDPSSSCHNTCLIFEFVFFLLSHVFLFVSLQKWFTCLFTLRYIHLSHSVTLYPQSYYSKFWIGVLVSKYCEQKLNSGPYSATGLQEDLTFAMNMPKFSSIISPCATIPHKEGETPVKGITLYLHQCNS